MNTKTDTRRSEQQMAPQAESKGDLVAGGSVKLRLLYPKSLAEYAGIDQRGWQVLIDAIFPSAKTTEAIVMAVAYCRSRNLDIFKKVVHIVPMYSKTAGHDGKGGEIETVWPGIAEVRITATRTGIYAGKDAAEFGQEVTKNFQYIDDRSGDIKEELEVAFPEWCRVTVYKIIQGVRCAFVGPKVYWEESYATKSRWSAVPNDMWADRRSGQLEKCAEAAALRAAFPEELGNEYTAEEMHGRVIDATPTHINTSPTTEVTPPRPERSEFERKPEKKPAAAKAAEKTAADPRPEPEPEPEINDAEVVDETNDTQANDGPTVDSEYEDWYGDMKGELAGITRIRDLGAHRETVLEQIDTPERAKAWNAACDTRQKEILESTRAAKTKK